MQKEKRWVLYSLLALMVILLITGWGNQVQSQEKYPTRAIDTIVPYAPGGSTDLSARIRCAYLSKKMGSPCERDQQAGW